MKAAVKKLLALAAALWLALGLSAPALAVVQPTEDFYVADYAGVLSEHTKNYIIEKNDYLYDACGAQIVVVTVDDTDGLTLEEYGYQLANEWGIGSAEKDNGVLLLLSIGGDDYQCMQGAGLEDQLPTTTLSRILREDLEPDFAKGDYNKGVNNTFIALFGQVCHIYDVPFPGPTVKAASGTQARVTKLDIKLFLLVFGFGIALPLLLALVMPSFPSKPLVRYLPRQQTPYPGAGPASSGRAAPSSDVWGAKKRERSWRDEEEEPAPFARRSAPPPEEPAYSSPPSRPSRDSSSSRSGSSASFSSPPSRSSSSASFSGSPTRSTPSTGTSSGGGAPRSGGGGSFRGGGAGRGH